MTPLVLGLGVPELLIILAVVLLLFGGARLAGLGKSTGRALREFKEETKGLKSDDTEDGTAGYIAVLDGTVDVTAGDDGVVAQSDALDERVGTFLARFDEYALERAAAEDADLAAGIDRGPLQGIPVAVKDILAMAEGPTTANSLVLDPAWGAGKDAIVVERLKAAGAVITDLADQVVLEAHHLRVVEGSVDRRDQGVPLTQDGNESGTAVHELSVTSRRVTR